MKTPTVLLTVILTAALAACGPPAPPPEASICARTADHVRVDDGQCAPGSPALAAGTVRRLDADTACLDAGDHTPVGSVADDDYLEGCAGEDDDGHAKARSSSKKTTAKKAAPTTTKKRPITRPTS